MVKVTCLRGHNYRSFDTRHIKKANAQDARGILSDLLIDTYQCEKCNAKAIRNLVVLQQLPSLSQV